ncbi:MAG: Rne/Rng family ribonuclease [Hymenobacteraceae bacterium]|nr:Rne/Rng family ribonuclease [Hymenobacteraceae bacterium]
MSNELIISSTPDGERIALLQDKRLVEYHVDRHDTPYAVGDIFLGTIKKVMPGLNAAFVDIGYEKDAFLHYGDLGEQFRVLDRYVGDVKRGKSQSGGLKGYGPEETPLDKLGKATDVLKKGQPLLVQILKEPISTKGPRLTCDISLAGRYLVLVPFSDVVSVSKKIISRQERDRLKRLIQSIKPEGFGVIVRTVAEGRDVADLDKDLRSVVETWEKGFVALKQAKERDKIIGELGRSTSILRDMLNESFDSIMVDSPEVFEETKTYLQRAAPERIGILKLYTGKTKVFEAHGIEKQLKTLFGKTVTVPGGGYLVIEHTEALHVIDVNSGSKSNAENNQEATAVAVNLTAAREVARQLRLRDMGGIVVVDFIDMRAAADRDKVFDAVRDAMRPDRARFTILPISKFGLLQITRQRVRPEQNIITSEVCPTCNGTGTINASILVTDEIDRIVDDLLVGQNQSGITIHVHPFLFAFYTKGIISRQMKWYLRYYKWVKLTKDTSLGLTDFRITDERGEEIELRPRSRPEQRQVPDEVFEGAETE